MPQTKRRVKKRKNSSTATKAADKDQPRPLTVQQQLLLADIDKQFATQMNGLERLYESKVIEFKRACIIIQLDIPPEMLDTVPVDHEHREPETAEDAEDEVLELPTKRVTRGQGGTAARYQFRTPNSNLDKGGVHYNAITPKVQPNAAMSVLRRPQEGEIAFALSGSPLLVSSRGGDDVANVNVPLADGKVLSILPQSGLRRSDMPAVDVDVMDQLQKLRDNINCLLGN